MFYQLFLTVVAFIVLSVVTAIPSPLAHIHHHRQENPDNIVKLESADNYCMIMPKNPHANIGDSESPGGMMTYCSATARWDDSQGTIPGGFWKISDYQSGSSPDTGARFAQLTGCIDSGMVDRLNPDDLGGQYDSSGGKKGEGNPANSVCLGYKHYIELIEPESGRACLKCCDDPDDCPLKRDTSGCPVVIPGNYFDCV
ncbi:hypothetical protein E1B28_011623 [Marasmius oreades]|uniref:Allergen protein n=1 Tax=Marasmius oreades TaxID=181124 RepID=A0A9P7URE3_9AGAR|nr:uncharacterized protein E1B28_011623 [Marasmius oreades]KAG7090001.1 hypothetical protein E1B28_011623 [Marasmius oreades]